MDIQELWDKYFELNDSEDYDEAKKCLETMVKHCEFDAISLIGDLYAKGEGVEQNYEKANEWLMLASDQGCVFAQYLLAENFYFGKGCEKCRR